MDINILLYDDFEALDVFGPVEILSKVEEYELHYYSLTGGAVKSAQNSIVMADNIDKADKGGILMVPGGLGIREMLSNPSFISMLKETAREACFCLTVCTGSVLLGKTGALDGKNATTNKKLLDMLKPINPNVNWIRKARWIADGKYYTASGVSAGMDMTLGFIRDQYGEQTAAAIARDIEYVWNPDSSEDLFA